MSTCGLSHLYTGAVCGKPAEHELMPADVVHRDGAVAWIHHEQEVGVDPAGDPIIDVWDERV